MNDIVTAQASVTAPTPWAEPTAAALAAIDAEMPVIRAEVELLDARITAMDRVPNEVDARRIRRARRKVLAARRSLANVPAFALNPGGAA
ncbi:DUF6284 family protein [Streptomyces spectabilis]|uniref:DUF6284 family protein n=1 Tax=Streptomyces spectabilis TaxID=68270 RepID=UPI0033E1BB36